MIDKLCCAQCGHLLVEKTSERFTFVAAELVRIAWEIFSSVACALHRAGVFGSLHNRFSETSRNFARSSFSLFVASSNAVISFIVFLLVVLQHRSCQREACAAPVGYPLRLAQLRHQASCASCNVWPLHHQSGEPSSSPDTRMTRETSLSRGPIDQPCADWMRVYVIT